MPPLSDIAKVRLVWAGAFLSGLVATDVFLRLFCSSWPLFMYLAVGGFGAWRAESLQRRCSGDGRGSRVVRGASRVLAGCTALGLVGLFAMPVNWDTKCSWRYCGRALSPGLFQSPFPVGTPSCRGWSTCVNEYPYSASDYRVAVSRLVDQGCPEP